MLVYTLVMLYRCVCSRNYAEWRAGWSHDMSYVQHDSGIQVCAIYFSNVIVGTYYLTSYLGYIRSSTN